MGKAFGPDDRTELDFTGTIRRLENEVSQLKQDKLFLERRNKELEQKLIDCERGNMASGHGY